ncbi:MAG: peptide deformylase [Candidatus Paceibacterota bacterium]
MPEIVQRTSPILHNEALPVPLEEIKSPKVAAVIEDMKKALASQKDGAAIAAPQIGVNLRIFVVSGRMLKIADKSYKGDGSDQVYINPEITKLSKEKKNLEEGCLSVRWLYGKVKRAARASITAYDENGELVKRGASGVLAQVFQHEVDHLNGILFTDKASDVWEMTEEEIREAQGKE